MNRNDSHYRVSPETDKRRTRLSGWRLALVVLVIGLLAAACTGSDASEETEPDGLLVVATTTVLGDVVANVVGDGAQVEVLLPVGVDPHDFRPSAQQAAVIEEADLVVANGLGLEEGLEDVLDAASGDGVRVLEVAPLVSPLPFGAEADAASGDDPHVWLDPLRMAEAARLVGAELDAAGGSGLFSGRAASYATELEQLDAEIIGLLAPIPEARRRLVTNHDALGYFADRYGFAIAGVVIPGGSTLADPSAGELSDLIKTMESEDINVVFADTTEPSVLAEAVASELGTGVEVVELYTGSLGEPGSGAETLIGMLRVNAERVAGALG